MGTTTTKSCAAALAGALLGLSGAARAVEPTQAEAAARRAFEDLQHGKDPAKTLPALLDALASANLPRSATVVLAVLSDAKDPAVRAAARAELSRRAQEDAALALPLLAKRDGDERDVPAALLVKLARNHLAQAIALAPPEEGAAFTAAGDGARDTAPAPRRTSAGAQAEAAPDAAGKELAAKDAAGTQPAGKAADAGASDAGSASAAGPEEAKVMAPAALAQLSRARTLAAAVSPDSPAAGEAHEVEGLAALAAGDAAAAEREFAGLVQKRPGASSAGPAEAERRDRAILQLARLAYARGNDAAAAALYARVSRAGPQWLDALFESSWAHFRRGDDEKALGNLLTLHAPFFQGRYFPESFVLKALLLYENCRFADATRTLAQFEKQYRPVHDALAGILAQIPTPQLAAELLAQGAPAVAQRVEAKGRADVSRLLFAPALVAEGAAAVQLAQELDSFDARAPAFRTSALAQALLPELRSARATLLERTGRSVRARLNGARGELRELLAQSLRLSYEIAGREKELAREGASGLPLSQRAARRLPEVDEDEELWPFQGEYWRDELGSYQFTLGERCRRAAPGVPAQLATPASPDASPASPDAPPAAAPGSPRGSAHGDAGSSARADAPSDSP